MDRRAFVEELVEYDTTAGNEAPAQQWLRERLDALGFDTFEWTADPARLADHPSFPDEPDPSYADRPSVAGALEFDADGPTLVLNGHVDIVPATGEGWSSPPFEPTWDGDRLTARGAADMKGGLAACVFAALDLRAAARAGRWDDPAGRVVVESVAGEEEGGVGAAAAALENPYPFDRDACVVAEPTELRPVVASEGSVMMRLRLRGQSAHAATPWRGVDVLEQFERVRGAFRELEADRAERVSHPLYDEYPVPWPVVCGTVDAGEWASSIPDALTAEWRIGVAPGETVAGVEAAFRERLEAVAADDGWLREYPPSFERCSVQFEPTEIDPDEPVVRAVRAGMAAVGLPETAPVGVTYGADARHYVEAGVPTVMFGPGSIDQAHSPDETVHWHEVERATDALAAAARRFLSR
jgi:acetylornithine deacetylase